MKGMNVTAWNSLSNMQTCLLLNVWITQYNSIQETQNVFFCGIHREIIQLLLCLLPLRLPYVLDLKFWVLYWCHSWSNYNIDCTVGTCTCGKKVQIHRMVWNGVFYLFHHNAEIPQHFECVSGVDILLVLCIMLQHCLEPMHDPSTI